MAEPSSNASGVALRHAPLVLACLLAGGLASYVSTTQSTDTYSSEAVIFVAAGQTSTAGGVYERARFAQERVKSYVGLVNAPEVMSGVAKQLSLSTPLTALQDQVSATTSPGTVLISIKAEDASAVGARNIANATALGFARFAVDLEGKDGAASAVDIRVIRPATVNTDPVGLGRWPTTGLGAIVGLVAGGCLASLRERLSPTPRAVVATEDIGSFEGVDKRFISVEQSEADYLAEGRHDGSVPARRTQRR